MTDIDDKVLDELHREAVRYMETGNYARSRRVMVSDRDAAITELRARVEEWWDYCDELQQRNDELQVALGWAKTEARQVTREQINVAAENICWALDNGLSFEEIAARIAEDWSLTITEEAPKAEGRECKMCDGLGVHIPEEEFIRRGSDAPVYDCRYCQGKGTITEGERDE